jgi:hypothetical protein
LSWIDQRTGGRVHDLQVQTEGDRVVVYGRTSSYHIRQLALAAVLEAADPEVVELRIDVV